MDAAIQLHLDVCLMTTNLDVLDQYALCLQGTASKILVHGLGSRGFSFSRGGCGCPGTPGPPRFCSVGGYGPVAAFIRSGDDPLRS